MITAWSMLFAIALSAAPVPRDVEAPDSLLPLRLATARVNCTATPTSGGRILVAGGLRSQHELTSGLDDAELVDPLHDGGRGRVSGPLPLAGKLFAARAFHVAIGLDDGRVLLVAGDLAGSVEVFDPSVGARGEFRTLGALRFGPRFGLTATRLPDGRVLVAGGVFANRKPTARTELFDPATGLATPGPDLSCPRHSHTATLLPDGRVLLAGGVGVRSTDLFDPESGRIEKGPDLSIERDDHAATLLRDGRVLLTGGQDKMATTLDSADLFDPRSGRCAAAGPLAEARADHAQLLLADGRVLVIGGERDTGDDRDVVLDSVECFDPETARFESCAPLRVARDDGAAILLPDGRVALFGGQTRDDHSMAGVEFYVP